MCVHGTNLEIPGDQENGLNLENGFNLEIHLNLASADNLEIQHNATFNRQTRSNNTKSNTRSG